MDQVGQIKEKLDIVTFISEYIPLKKAGRNFNANCPFHNEKSPSFVVSPERQIWHCFGCAKGGDVYAFLMEYEKVEFGEALRMLAKRTGIELVSNEATSGIASKKELIYRINGFAKEYYHYVLTKHKAGERARLYLEERGITAKIIETFMLGFSPPSGSALSDYLVKKKKYPILEVVDAGLAFQRGNRLVDFFRGRLMFPLVDHRDNVIGFSGRILDADAETSKYINTRETLAYHKGDHFYGLNITKDAVRKSGQAIIVEGEFDVISCFQNGIANVVGVKGTALTENQVSLLARYAHKITFCFDGDKAGQEAIKRSLSVVEKKGLTPTVIEIPGGKDPDEALRTEAGLFKKAVDHDSDIYDYLLRRAVASVDVQTPEGKKHVADTLLPFVANIKNEIIKEHYIRKISSELDTSHESILREMQRLRVPDAVRLEQAAPKTKRPKEEVLEEYLLSLILQSGKPKVCLQRTMAILSDLFSQERSHQKILRLMAEYSEKADTWDSQRFGDSLPKELHASYDTCLLFPLPQFIDEKRFNEEIEKIANNLKIAYIQNKMKKLADKIKETEGKKDTEGREVEDEELKALKTEYSELAKQLDGAP